LFCFVGGDAEFGRAKKVRTHPLGGLPLPFELLDELTLEATSQSRSQVLASLSGSTQGFGRRLTTTVIKGVLVWAFLLVPFDLSDPFKKVR
jgi:hypothetical protein